MHSSGNQLGDVLARSFHAFWRKLQAEQRGEQLYAAGFFTTCDGVYFVPFALGEDGLTRAAGRYLGQPGYETLDAARAALRWSVPDVAYRGDGDGDGDDAATRAVDEALLARGDVYTMPERAADKEIRARLDAAVEALRSLDAEGLFGTGEARARIVLLIEAGDRNDEWMLKLAKKVNPKPVFDAFAKLFAFPVVGKFTELGAKKVYETNALSLAGDGRTLAAFCDYDLFCFDLATRKQLASRRLRRGELPMHFWSGAISGDGRTLAAAWSSGGRPEYGVTLWRGTKWAETLEILLPQGAQPMDVVLAPAGEWLAVSSHDKAIRVFATADGRLLETLQGHDEWPRTLALTRDGRMLASADVKGGVRLWDTRSWVVTAQIDRAADGVRFDAGGERLIAWARHPQNDDDDAGRVATVWDVATRSVVTELRVPGQRIVRASLSDDGTRAALGLRDAADITKQSAVLVDVATGAIRSRLSADFEWFSEFVFLPEDNLIAVAVRGHYRKPVLLWDSGG